MTPTALQHVDDLVACEAASGRHPDAQDVVTCAETPILIGGEWGIRANQKETLDWVLSYIYFKDS